MYSALKASQLRQARSLGGTSTLAVTQSYGIYYLTGHVLKGVQQDDQEASVVLSASPAQVFAQGPKLVPSIAVFRRTSFILIHTANRLYTTKPASKGKLDASTVHRTKIKPNRCSLSLQFFLSRFSFTDTDKSQESKENDGDHLYSSLPLAPIRQYSDNYLHFCM